VASLKDGDGGIDVKRLQILLNSGLVPSPHLREDGDFGTRTRDAVMRFQKLRGLMPDGVVGHLTWFALGQKGITSAVAGPPISRRPRRGSWLDIAKAELGVHEDALAGHHTQRIVEYHKTTTLKATADETPWCSSFVNWVMIKAGWNGTNSAAARSWLDWGTSLLEPREGAVTVIKRKNATSDAATGSASGFHVAFYIASPRDHIRLLGGNQGDWVKYSSFSLKAYEVKGYRWP
jgi:uncharacterized protein (TIGR02594 family)